MIFNYNGHPYSFDGDTLRQGHSRGLILASIEWAKDSNWDEYNYLIHAESEEVITSVHENKRIPDYGYFLAAQYEAFEE